MKTERLLKLADHLENVVALVPETFDLKEWTQPGPWKGPGECGTTCCAVGHACEIPEFKAAGLRMGYSRAEPIYEAGYVWRGWLAVRAFFEISQEHAAHLFDAARYPNWNLTSPIEVAARIRELVANRRIAQRAAA